MICPKCGYAMDAFDKECPRCHGQGAPQAAPKAAPPAQRPGPLPPTQQPTQPPATSPFATSPFAPAPLTAEQKAKAEAQGQTCAKWGCGCLLVPVLLIILGMIFGDSRPGAGEAYYLAKQSISRQLKAPSTAVFPSHVASGVFIKESGDTFHITSYVDSQNGFGAMIRARWVATVQRSADGENLTVLSATLLE